jgi:RNA polymerase sigma-70 factor (ECF subfamily)
MPREPRDDVHAFPQTQWTLVGLVGQTTSEGQREALGLLLDRYLPALRTYLLLDRRLPPDRAEDVLQGFIASKVLEQKIIKRSDRTRGKFRTFLLRALHNYLIDQSRYANAQERAPAEGLANVDDHLNVTADDPPPSQAFDTAWAREVIAEAVKLMRHECEAGGRPDIWGIFEDRVLKPSMENATPMEYDELVKRLGLQSPQQASNVLMTAKRMFARALRSVVSEYAEPEGIEDEVRELKGVLARGN